MKTRTVTPNSMLLFSTMVLVLLMMLTGCGNSTASSADSSAATPASTVAEAEETEGFGEAEETPDVSFQPVVPAESAIEASNEEASAVEDEDVYATETAEEAFSPVIAVANVTSGGMLDAAEFFTERDLTQNADLQDAVSCDVSTQNELRITEAGTYLLSGAAEDFTVYVEAEKDAKIQLVLDSLQITNSDFPCIYVTSADKVFITTLNECTLSVTDAFRADGETNTDGVIFSRTDLTMNGTGVLNITSAKHGIVCKDDLKVTGGSYNITAAGKALEANDSIRISDGALYLVAGTDGIHAADDEDDTTGFIYICGGSLVISAGDDGIHATTVVQIDGGSITISSAEGIEGTYLQFNDGEITVDASDDGINGAAKSSAYSPTIEINGGMLTVSVGAGDTDGIDCNGDLYINGGTVDVTGNSTLDYDGVGEFNGGTLIVNGQQTDTLPNQMGGRGMKGW